MEGWVDLRYPAVHWPGVELGTSRSQARCPNHYTTEPRIITGEYVYWWLLKKSRSKITNTAHLKMNWHCYPIANASVKDGHVSTATFVETGWKGECRTGSVKLYNIWIGAKINFCLIEQCKPAETVHFLIASIVAICSRKLSVWPTGVRRSPRDTTPDGQQWNSLISFSSYWCDWRQVVLS